MTPRSLDASEQKEEEEKKKKKKRKSHREKQILPGRGSSSWKAC
jgi:hypothetical protein